MSRKRIDRGMLAILLLSTLLLAVQAEPAQAQQDQNAELMEQMDTVTQKASQAVGELKNFFEDSRVQVAIVVVLVVLGLTLWLLGARAGRLLFALLLGTAAIIPGMYLFEVLELPLWPGALVGGLVGMLVGVFIFKVGIMLVGMCISTLLAVGIFTAVGMEAEDRAELAKAAQEWLVQVEQSSVVPRLYAAGETTYPVEETPIEGVSPTAGVVFQGQAEDLSSILGKLGGKYRNGLLVSAVAGLAGGLLLQLFARSFMLVLTTSFLGTSMVLGGVCLGLAFRGKQANELLGLKPISSMVIFVVMLGLGMLVQLTMTRKRGEAEEEEEEE
ncbi:MAG: hypothetical protein KAT11_06730 [Phycisphaerae bacterium]|nr:hypothetical protein [Phycisphaerae bacterium]